MKTPKADELQVTTLGECTVPSPLRGRRERFAGDDRVLLCSRRDELEPLLTDDPLPTFESAGPRADIFFHSEHLTCGIVTCGGLCPGLNDVIRSVFLTLHHAYGVRRILGFRYGFAGLSSERSADPMLLDPRMVDAIHRRGGTLIGTSRGPHCVENMVDQLMKWRVDILFAVGGDGTLKGASAIAAEVAQRGLKIAVIGIPKTIDNDLRWTERTFGFSTAVEEAHAAIDAAHAEARAAWNGIGLVKLMGRHSGFIAAHAALASGDVNFCLVPEVPFTLDGEGGLLQYLDQRLADRHHAVVVVAEGAGQHLVEGDSDARDPSGNVRLKDIGRYLRWRLVDHFEQRRVPIDLKYIDPSYIIRSHPANSLDSSFCLMLGQHAVHAGMAGRTDMMVGFWNQHFTHVPLRLITSRKPLDPDGEIWQRVLETTGQPASMAGRS